MCIIGRSPAPVKVKSEMRAKMPAVGISIVGDVVIIIRMESVVMIVNGGCIPGSGSMGNHRAYISIPVPGFIIFEIVEFGIHPSILIRSEEHTSELQSRGHLLCRLL